MGVLQPSKMFSQKGSFWHVSCPLMTAIYLIYQEYDALVADSKKDKADLAKLGVAAQVHIAALN